MPQAKVLNGKLREVWTESTPHPGGAGGVARTITTAIRVKRPASDGSRLRGYIYLTNIVNNPSIGGVFSILADGTVVLTITNSSVNAADTATYAVDIQLLHSIEQANDAAYPLGACATLINSANPGNLADHETRHINGGADEILQLVREDVAGGNVAAGDGTILGNSAGGGIQFALPLATVAIIGREYTVKNISALGGITLVPQAGEFIDGGPNVLLPLLYDSVTVKCIGAGAWSIVKRYPINAAHEANHLNNGADEILGVITAPGATPQTLLRATRYARITTGAGLYTFNLYATGAGDVGRLHTITKIDAGAGAIDVDPAGAEQINLAGAGVAYNIAGAQWNSITILCVAIGFWEIVAIAP